MPNRGNCPLQPDNPEDFGRQSGPSAAPMPNARPWRRGQAPQPRSGAPKAQGWTAAPAVVAQSFRPSAAAEHAVDSTGNIVPKAPSATPRFHTTLTGTTGRRAGSCHLTPLSDGRGPARQRAQRIPRSGRPAVIVGQRRLGAALAHSALERPAPAAPLAIAEIAVCKRQGPPCGHACAADPGSILESGETPCLARGWCG
jgi:hypothetical protein